MPEDNGITRSYRDESYTNKYKTYVTCSYGSKLVCVDDNFINPFKSYFVEHALCKKRLNT